MSLAKAELAASLIGVERLSGSYGMSWSGKDSQGRGDLQVYKRRGKVMRKDMGVEILMPASDTDWAKNWKWWEDHGGLKYQSKRGGVCLCSFCEQRLEGHLPEVLCNGSLP